MRKKIDILLIDPPWYRFFGQQSSLKPLGLCSLAAILEQNGFNALVYKTDGRPGEEFLEAVNTTRKYRNYLKRMDDFNDSVWRDVEKNILDHPASIIGIGMVTAKYRSAVNLAKLIRKNNPKVKIIAGGSHPTLCPEEVLKTKLFDVVVKGEGERTIVDVMNAFNKEKSFSEIAGISYWDKGKIKHNPDRELINDLDSLPVPANHLLINQQTMLPDDFSYLMASRGCPYHCIFCAAYKIWTRRVRFRKPENIIEEIKQIKRKYNPVYFHFQDDSFTLDRKFVFKFCQLIKNEKLKIRWVCETRADLIDEEIAKKIKKAGCFKVVLGAESGNEEILRKIKKHVTSDQIRKAVAVCKKNHIETSLFFMIGFPWETEKEIMDTVNFMEELDPQYAVFSVATPYPETELYRECQKQGLLTKEPDWGKFFHQSPEMFLTNKMSAKQTKKLIEMVEEKFCRHNKKKHRLKLLNPFRMFREVKRIYRQPKEVLSKVKYILSK